MPKKKKVSLEIVTKCQIKDCKSTEAFPRRYYAKSYTGSCGDSFCYANCTDATCREQSAVLCDKHYKQLAKDPK